MQRTKGSRDICTPQLHAGLIVHQKRNRLCFLEMCQRVVSVHCHSFHNSTDQNVCRLCTDGDAFRQGRPACRSVTCGKRTTMCVHCLRSCVSNMPTSVPGRLICREATLRISSRAAKKLNCVGSPLSGRLKCDCAQKGAASGSPPIRRNGHLPE